MRRTSSRLKIPIDGGEVEDLLHKLALLSASLLGRAPLCLVQYRLAVLMDG